MNRKFQTVMLLCTVFLCVSSLRAEEEQSRKVELHTIKCQSVKMSGDTQVPVPAIYNFVSSNFHFYNPEDRKGNETQQTNEQGRFEILCSNSPVTVFVRTAEDAPEQLAKVLRLPKGETEATFVLEPYGKIEGKIIHKKTGEPLPDVPVGSCVHVAAEEDSVYRPSFAVTTTTTTNENGDYILENIPPGHSQYLHVRFGPRGEKPNSSWRVKNVLPKPGETIQVGEYRFNPLPNPSTEYYWIFHNAPRMMTFLHQEDDPIEKRFEILLERCRKEGKKLIAISAKMENDSPDQKFISDLCEMLHADEEVFQWTDHFYLMALPTDEKVESQYDKPYRENCAAFMKKHGIKETALDAVTFCFFDAEGTLLGFESSWGVKEPKFTESEKLEFNLNKAVLVDMLKKYARKQKPEKKPL